MSQWTGRWILGDPPIDRPGLEETNQDRERPFAVDFTEINDLLVSDVSFVSLTKVLVGSLP